MSALTGSYKNLAAMDKPEPATGSKGSEASIHRVPRRPTAGSFHESDALGKLVPSVVLGPFSLVDCAAHGYSDTYCNHAHSSISSSETSSTVDKCPGNASNCQPMDDPPLGSGTFLMPQQYPANPHLGLACNLRPVAAPYRYSGDSKSSSGKSKELIFHIRKLLSVIDDHEALGVIDTHCRTHLACRNGRPDPTQSPEPYS